MRTPVQIKEGKYYVSLIDTKKGRKKGDVIFIEYVTPVTQGTQRFIGYDYQGNKFSETFSTVLSRTVREAFTSEINDYEQRGIYNTSQAKELLANNV